MSLAVEPVPAQAPSGAAGPERILVRGVNWLGDAVMTTPALLRLRERWPHARITLLTAAKLTDLWLHHPAVDEVIPFAAGDPPWRLGRRLRAGGFDLGILFTDSPRSALELWLGGVRRRTGFAGKWRRALLTEVVDRSPGWVPMRKRKPGEIRELLSRAPTSATLPPAAHQMHHYLRLVAWLGANPEPLAPRVCLSAAELAQARTKVLELAGPVAGFTRTPPRWLGLNAGAEYGPAKRWPVERFAAVANEVSRQAGVNWLILGGPNDRTLAAEIQQVVPTSVSLAGRTTLRELMVVLSACELLLTNDTGPTHLAAALGTPVVAIFGSTSPELTGPGLPGDPRHAILREPVPCAPCFLRECPVDFRCMTGVTVEQVTRTVLARLVS